MIKALLKPQNDVGIDRVFLGIDRENVKRLKQKKPIRVLGSDLGIDVDIYIVYGDTLEAIKNEYHLPTVQ